MNLSQAREVLDDMIHSPVRFTLVATLSSVDSADYQTLREELGISYSMLSKHAGILEEVGYLKITKEFDGRTQIARMSLTRQGREAFQKHLSALDRIVQGLS